MGHQLDDSGEQSRSMSAPYEELSLFYDQLMAHVDYNHWSRFTSDILLRHVATERNVSRLRLLEAGCGTGTLAVSLSKYNLDVDAFDRSPGMINVARKKTVELTSPPRFFVGSFENFEVDSTYDAAICLYDSINYLLDPEEVTRFLSRIRGVLKPGGVFLFDICTELNSILHFNGRKESESGNGYKYTRTMRYKHGSRIQENIFDIEFRGPPPRTVVEHHRQKIYSSDEIKSYIAESGLTLIEELDGYERRRPTSRSLRIHFLVKKPLR